jgi:hypothetical protein
VGSVADFRRILIEYPWEWTDQERSTMPVRKTKGGGYKYGAGGKTYYGKGAKAKAAKQGRAIAVSKARAKGHRIKKR